MSDQELFLDLALARRIEMAEAQAAVECTETYERLRPGSNTAVERIGGGFAIYCGPNLPTTQAVGLGLDGPIGEEEFDRLEEFYRSRGEAVRVESCPLADLSLFEQFGRRGYRVTEFSSVMARTMPTQMTMENWDAPAGGVTIEKVEEEHFELWTFTVAQGFAEHYPVTQELLNVMKMFAQGASAECYLARIDGKVAGGATLAVRDGVAGLFGASTLPAFRNRGVQTALLRTRLARAAAAGCDLAVSLAQPGSASERNIRRQNFYVLYTRVKFEKAFAA
ncbi:MAG TPA: GNAT family N-acetyltransferase [Candidatus Dormibacteraeota bacterium]|nr:GNAT family N-acetyltransferase [Candidatus Dormibacteraeota bacterium]